MSASLSTKPQEVDRFDMNGNGCDGFRLSGVSAGDTWRSKYSRRLASLGRRKFVPGREPHPMLHQPLAQVLEACSTAQKQRIQRIAQPMDVRVEFLDDGEIAARVGAGAHGTDALHEELVQVRGEDRQELEPLEQRHALVDGFRQDPAVEFEPAEVPVEPGLLQHPRAQLRVHFDDSPPAPVPAGESGGNRQLGYRIYRRRYRIVAV